MCGICGIIHSDHERPVEPRVVERMKQCIAHRGPDDDGTHLDGSVGLGFRRLSIVDLRLGHQPMSNEDGTVWVVFNGEIYNHEELRADLLARGHSYRTRADTETIVHLYEEEGAAGFAKLNGMFAFCIWDARRRRAILVRDRVGVKPLYYARTRHGLAFASEIKALLEVNGVPRAPNTEAVAEYLMFRYAAGPSTMFEGIRSLEPGHMLVVQGGRVSDTAYWDLPDLEDVRTADEPAALRELEELLEDSVRMQLMSDVPVGSFCSGGIDSGLTTAYATKHGKLGIDTFSVGFHEADFDESVFARMVSDQYETRHHTLTIDNQSFADSLPRVIWYHDEPLNHANSVPIHHIARLAREFVTVVLTGEGSDELFAGYPRYNVAKICATAMVGPKIWRSALGVLAGLTSLRRVRKLGSFLPLDAADVAVFNSAFVDRDVVEALVAPGIPPATLAYRRSMTRDPKVGRHDLLPRLWRLDLRTYLVSLLHRMDKMTMAASLEARVPFLDHRLVEWALRLPPSLRLHGFVNKYLVRRLGLSLLPHPVVNRPKSGFGVPIGRWARDPRLLGRYLDLFFEPRFRERGYLDVPRVQALVRQHQDGHRDLGEVLWNLMNLELWHRIFIDRDQSWLTREAA